VRTQGQQGREGEGEGRERGRGGRGGGEGGRGEGREVRPHGCTMSAWTLGCVRADASVLPQVISKRTLQCVQVTVTPAAIVQLSVRPSVRNRPCDNPNVRGLY
jgi:hypothetical protein